MSYYADIAQLVEQLTGRYTAEVEAKKLAMEKWESADFGELEDVGEYGFKRGTIEDENGKLFD